MVTIGIDCLIRDESAVTRGGRVGLLANQASINGEFRHSRDLLKGAIGDRLTCLFSPQHGFNGEKQDNMIESDHGLDHVSGLPVYSLYRDTRKPTVEMYRNLDVLVIDLVDVGTRVYTFLYTMAYCLEAAAEQGKKVVVLDRPNPIGGIKVEGNIVDAECRSFVGLYPLPMRHGLTFAELALFINSEYGIGADLEVVKMEGWKRQMLYGDTGLPWMYPSPNMPTPGTALVYPGQVLWEGTNVSEGRGTTRPFELVGAPYWNHDQILEKLLETDLPGCVFQPVVFEPTSGKWAGRACSGFYLHVTDAASFLPYRTSLALLQAVMNLYPDRFAYKQPPYEYEFEKLPMDLILGDRRVRTELEKGTPVVEIEQGWQEELERFNDKRVRYLLYPMTD